MQETNCPICFEPLEVRTVTPCVDCGGFPKELEHFVESKHTYHVVRILDQFRLTQRDFCMVDFGSYDPRFFGLAGNTRIGYEHMDELEELVDPAIGKDKFCTKCGYRLAFLKFVCAVRAMAGRPNPQ